MVRSSYEPGTQGAWLPVYGGLVATGVVALELVPQAAPSLSWWHLLAAAVVAVVVAFLATMLQEASRGQSGWFRVVAHRCVTVAGLGGWATWADLTGWHAWTVLSLLGGVACSSVIGAHCQTPAALPRGAADTPEPGVDRRDPGIRYWETVIRQVSRLQVVVTGWQSWDQPEDGLRLTVELPADQGTKASDLVGHAEGIAASARLPDGCAVRVLNSDIQGIVYVDVMLRYSLHDYAGVHEEPTTPASILDEFPVLRTPRGDVLTICLRKFSMIIGGTVDSGKTTLLHRIIMWLARCTDTLIWVVDLNGGGVATPWIHPWANKLVDKPVVDWVADNEPEAAVMAAVARAVAVDRKTNREAARRKRAANDTLLPVDAAMPAFVILTDEGGEVRQAASLFGQLAGQGITRLAQIARAEGGRVVVSVLRGTSDLTDKALRVVAAIRLCLRMEEHEEYSHVLAANPGKVELEGVSGAGFLRTAKLSRPVLGRTMNVDLRGIERHAIACAGLRPDLDEWGLRAAARVRPSDVLGGREPADEHMDNQPMQDCLTGAAYTGRWDRYAAKLAGMRGEETADDAPAEAGDGQPTGQPRASGAPSRTSALDAWEASVARCAGAVRKPAQAPASAEREGARIIRFPRPADVTPKAPDTARERILALLHEAGPEGLPSSRVAEQVQATRSRVFDLLKQLRDEGSIGRNEAGANVVAEYARTTAG